MRHFWHMRRRLATPGFGEHEGSANSELKSSKKHQNIWFSVLKEIISHQYLQQLYKKENFKSRKGFIQKLQTIISVYSVDSKENVRETKSNRQAITSTCFRRCQGVAVRLKVFIWFFTFYIIILI